MPAAATGRGDGSSGRRPQQGPVNPQIRGVRCWRQPVGGDQEHLRQHPPLAVTVVPQTLPGEAPLLHAFVQLAQHDSIS